MLHNSTTEMLTIKADNMLLVVSQTGSLDTTTSYLQCLVREIFGCVTITKVNPPFTSYTLRCLVACQRSSMRTILHALQPSLMCSLQATTSRPCTLFRPFLGHLACQLLCQASAL
jgi:hypothetical protein